MIYNGIENAMVIGDYYDETPRSAAPDEPVDCPCIFCGKHCDETCEEEDDA